MAVFENDMVHKKTAVHIIHKVGERLLAQFAEIDEDIIIINTVRKWFDELEDIFIDFECPEHIKHSKG